VVVTPMTGRLDVVAVVLVVLVTITDVDADAAEGESVVEVRFTSSRDFGLVPS
jgi:hypothetical protein